MVYVVIGLLVAVVLVAVLIVKRYKLQSRAGVIVHEVGKEIGKDIHDTGKKVGEVIGKAKDVVK